MTTPASIGRHPLHPMLVAVPIGLFVAALVFDVLWLVTGESVWRSVAFWNISVGLVGALVAAVPGLIDYFALTHTAARLATWHLGANVVMLAIFGVNWLLRTTWAPAWIPADSNIPAILTFLGVVMLGVSGWLGAHLVYVEGVGIDDAFRRDERARRRAA